MRTTQNPLVGGDVESSGLASKIFSYCNEVVVVVDAEAFIRCQSPNVSRVFGWHPDDLIGKSVFELFHPERRSEVEGFVKRIMAQADCDGTLETLYRRKDGEYVWIELHVTNLLQDPDVQGLVASITDITSRKIAAEKRTKSSELLTNLAKLVPGVIYQYRLDPDGQSAFPYSSPGMNDIYEVSPEEVQKDASPVFSRLHPEDAEMVSSEIIESSRNLTPFTCEFRVMLPRQGLRWRWSQALPERTPDGGTLWHGIIMDITDRKEAEERQKILQEQLTQSQKMESVGRLAGGVAHDFNNMLGVILGYADMLHESMSPEDENYSPLVEIISASERSAELTKQLLAFSRQQTVSPKPLDMNEVISGMTQMLSRLMGENIQLHWQDLPGLWLVALDPSQLYQVVVNLCVNARDAIEGDGTIAITANNEVIKEPVAVSSENMPPGDYVRLTISDTGCGMSNGVLKHLFEPFFTTKPQGKGTGLGLSTTYGIVKQNKGFIDVKSRVGEGSTFRIWLPRYIQIKSTHDQSRAVTEPVYMRDATILLVEDEPGLLDIAAKMLESAGYTVVRAESPAMAIETASTYQDIHLLVTDVIMPKMNGKQLFERIQTFHPRARVLYMSGYTADVIGQHGVLGSDVMFIPKPFTKGQLVDKVKEALGVRLNV